eukprot:403373465
MSDDSILEAQYREMKSIKVGVSRALFVLLPSSIFVTFQQAYIVQQIFGLDVLDYIFMFVICSLISVITLIYVYGNFINQIGEEILKTRQGDLLELGGDQSRKRQKNQPEQSNADAQANERKRQSIMSEINYESTFFGLWFINLVYLASFVFFSFVVVRFWSTGLNYYGSTIGAAALTNWIASTYLSTYY